MSGCRNSLKHDVVRSGKPALAVSFMRELHGWYMLKCMDVAGQALLASAVLLMRNLHVRCCFHISASSRLEQLHACSLYSGT